MLIAALGHGMVYSYASYEKGTKKTLFFAVRDVGASNTTKQTPPPNKRHLCTLPADAMGIVDGK